MKIVWTNAAIGDLQSIRDYIARDSEHYAARFIGRLIDAVSILERFPELGPVIPHLADKGVRERVVDHYRLLYQVQADRVLVLAVIHAHRDLGGADL